jgi:hypothetical protein
MHHSRLIVIQQSLVMYRFNSTAIPRYSLLECNEIKLLLLRAGNESILRQFTFREIETGIKRFMYKFGNKIRNLSCLFKMNCHEK